MLPPDVIFEDYMHRIKFRLALCSGLRCGSSQRSPSHFSWNLEVLLLRERREKKRERKEKRKKGGDDRREEREEKNRREGKYYIERFSRSATWTLCSAATCDLPKFTGFQIDIPPTPLFGFNQLF